MAQVGSVGPYWRWLSQAATTQVAVPTSSGWRAARRAVRYRAPRLSTVDPIDPIDPIVHVTLVEGGQVVFEVVHRPTASLSWGKMISWSSPSRSCHGPPSGHDPKASRSRNSWSLSNRRPLLY